MTRYTKITSSVSTSSTTLDELNDDISVQHLLGAESVKWLLEKLDGRAAQTS